MLALDSPEVPDNPDTPDTADTAETAETPLSDLLSGWLNGLAVSIEKAEWWHNGLILGIRQNLNESVTTPTGAEPKAHDKVRMQIPPHQYSLWIPIALACIRVQHPITYPSNGYYNVHLYLNYNIYTILTD